MERVSKLGDRLGDLKLFETGTVSGTRGKDKSQKTESRVITDSQKTEGGDQKSGFRDWRRKLRDVLAQVYQAFLSIQIPEWFKDPATKIPGMDAMEEPLQIAVENMEKIGSRLSSMPTRLPENKSEALLGKTMPK